MGISSHLPPSHYSLEGELTSWAKDSIQQYEKRAVALTSEVRKLDEQVQSLQELLDTVNTSISTKGSANLNDPAVAPLIQKLKEGGMNIPVPPDGVLTKQNVVDWAKIVDDDRVQVQNKVQQLQSRIPQTLQHLQETVSAIMKILEQIHQIISLIIRSISSHNK